MRKKILAGNWKMNLNRTESVLLVKEILSRINHNIDVDIVLAPSFVNLYKVAKICMHHNNIFIASQDCSAHDKGAYTGEVSADMILDSNASYVIIGHSERRTNFQETHQTLKSKVDRALSNKLKVIFCCGENLDQREKDTHLDCIRKQITESLFHLPKSELNNLVIAYEPVWAIGTGKTASSSQAQEMHFFIRELIQKQYDSTISKNISILYGGSCNPTNAKELFSQSDVDGGLIGGASLDAMDFARILNSF